MNRPSEPDGVLVSRAAQDCEFRECLLQNPKDAIEHEFGVTLAEGHEICVHEETYSETHVVLPPRSKLSEAEREEARSGATSLEFLRRTLHDPRAAAASRCAETRGFPAARGHRLGARGGGEGGYPPRT